MLSEGFRLVPVTTNTFTLHINTSSLPSTEHALGVLLKQLYGLSRKPRDLKKQQHTGK